MNTTPAILWRPSRRTFDVNALRLSLFLGTLVSLAAASSLGAEDKPEQPLVLEFEHCGHFEFVVHVGEDFHFVSMNKDRRMVVSGRVLSLRDGKCRLRFSIDYCGLGRHGAAHSSNRPEFTLRVGEPPYGAHGAIHSACMTTGPWIRRGLDPVPSLKAALARGGETYYAAAAALHDLGPRGAEAVPVLINVLQGELEIPPDAVGRSCEEMAARTLAAVGAEAKKAVPVLLEMELEDADDQTRVAVAVALWKIDQHPSAIPRLIALLGEERRTARFATLVALEEEIGPAGAPAAPAIRELLDSDDPWIRQRAAAALWRVARDPDAIDVHVDDLKNNDDGIRSYAAWRLGLIGPFAWEAVPALVEALLNGSGHAEDEIVEALAIIDPDARETLHLLTAAVRDDPSTAGVAGRALGGMGKSILPKMQKFMLADEPGLRSMGTLAMYYAGAESVPYFVPLLKHPDPEISEAAAFCLRDLGSEATAAIPALIQCIADDHPEIPNGAGAALVQMKDAAVGPLQQLLDHEKKQVRQTAARLLEEMNLPKERDASSERFIDCLPD